MGEKEREKEDEGSRDDAEWQQARDGRARLAVQQF